MIEVKDNVGSKTGQEIAIQAVDETLIGLREEGEEISAEVEATVRKALTTDPDHYAVTIAAITQLFSYRPDLMAQVVAMAKLRQIQHGHGYVNRPEIPEPTINGV